MSNRTFNVIVVALAIGSLLWLTGAIKFGGDASPVGSPADSGVVPPVPDVNIEIPSIPFTPAVFASPTPSSGQTMPSPTLATKRIETPTQPPTLKPYSYQGNFFSEQEAKEAVRQGMVGVGYDAGLADAAVAWAFTYRGGDLADVSRFLSVNAYLDQVGYEGLADRGGLIDHALNWADRYHAGSLQEVGRYFWETFGIGAPVNNYAQARADSQNDGNIDPGWTEGGGDHSFTYGADYGQGQTFWSQEELSELFQQDGYNQQEIEKIFTEYASQHGGNIAGAEAWIYDQNTSPAYGGTPSEAVAPVNSDVESFLFNYEGSWLTREQAEIQIAAYIRIWHSEWKDLGIEEVVSLAQAEIDEIIAWAAEENDYSLHGYKTEMNARFGYGY